MTTSGDMSPKPVEELLWPSPASEKDRQPQKKNDIGQDSTDQGQVGDRKLPTNQEYSGAGCELQHFRLLVRRGTC